MEVKEEEKPTPRSSFLRKKNAHSTSENAHHPLLIGVRCVLAVKKEVNSRGAPIFLHLCANPRDRVVEPEGLVDARLVKCGGVCDYVDGQTAEGGR